MKKTFLYLLLFISNVLVSQTSTFHKIYNIPGSYAECVKQTADNGYILCGTLMTDTNNFTSYAGFLMKTDSVGAIQWMKKYDKFNKCEQVIANTNNGFLIMGTYRDPSSSYSSFLIMQTDYFGNPVWQKKIDSLTSNVIIKSTILTSQKEIVFIGTRNGKCSIIKSDTLGNIIWSKIYSNGQYDNPVNVDEINGLLYVTGSTYNQPTSYNGFILVFDQNGNYVRGKNLNSYASWVYSPLKFSKNELYFGSEYALTGSTGGMGIFKTDTLLNMYWLKAYQGGAYFGEAFEVYPTEDNNLIFDIEPEGFGSNGNNCQRGGLMKMDTSGNILWAVLNDTLTSPFFPLDFIKTNDHSYLSVGSLWYPTNSAGNRIQMVKANLLGYSSCYNEGVSYNSIYPTLAYAAATPTLVASNSFHAINDITTDTIMATTGIEKNYCSITDGIKKEILSEEFIISPNPSNGLFNVAVEDRKRVYQLKILNSNGIELKKEGFFYQNYLVDLRGFPSGLYIFNLFEGNKFISSKKVLINK